MSALQDFDQKLSTFIKFRPAPTADEQYGAWFATVYEFTEKTAQAVGLANSAVTPAVKVQPEALCRSAEIALPSFGKLAEAKETIVEQNLRYFDAWPRCWNTNQAADLCDPARRVIECLQLGSEDELQQLQQRLEAGAGRRFLELLRKRYGEALKSYVTQRTLRMMIEDFLAAESRLAPAAPAVEPKAAEAEQTQVTTSPQEVLPTVPSAQRELWEDAAPTEVVPDAEEAEPEVDTVENLMAEASTPGQVLSFPELYPLSVENRKKLLVKVLASASDDDWGFKDGLATCPELLLTAAQALKDFSLKELTPYIREGKQREEMKTILSTRKPEHAGFAFWQELAATHAKAEGVASDVVPMVANVVESPVKSLNEEASSNLTENPNGDVAKVLTVKPDGQYDIRYRFHRETIQCYVRTLASDIKSLGLTELDVAVRAFGATNINTIRNGFQAVRHLYKDLNFRVMKTDSFEIVRIVRSKMPDEDNAKVLTVQPNGQYEIRFRKPIEPLRSYVKVLLTDVQMLALPSVDIGLGAFGDTNVQWIRECFRNVLRVYEGSKFKVRIKNKLGVVRISGMDSPALLEEEGIKNVPTPKRGRKIKLVKVLALKENGQYDVRFRAAHETMSAYARALMEDMESLSLTKFNIRIEAFDEPNLAKIKQCFHNIQYRIDTDLIYSVKSTDSPDVVCITSKPETEKKIYQPRLRQAKQTVSTNTDKKQASVPVQTKPELSMPKMREAIEETLVNGSATMDVSGIPEKEVEESLRHLLDRIRYTGAIDYVCADGVLILEKRAVA